MEQFPGQNRWSLCWAPVGVNMADAPENLVIRLLQELRAQMDARFTTMDARFAQLEERFDRFEAVLREQKDELDTASALVLCAIGDRILWTQMQRRIGKLEARLDELQAQIGKRPS